MDSDTMFQYEQSVTMLCNWFGKDNLREIATAHMKFFFGASPYYSIARYGIGIRKDIPEKTVTSDITGTQIAQIMAKLRKTVAFTYNTDSTPDERLKWKFLTNELSTYSYAAYIIYDKSKDINREDSLKTIVVINKTTGTVSIADYLVPYFKRNTSHHPSFMMILYPFFSTQDTAKQLTEKSSLTEEEAHILINYMKEQQNK